MTAKVAGRSLRLDKELDNTLPLLYDFLGVPDPDHLPPPMEPEAKQRRLFAFLKRLTHAQSRREPTVFLFEDLHRRRRRLCRSTVPSEASL
jgi:hypothetical protein